MVTGDFNRMSRRWPTVVRFVRRDCFRRDPVRAVPRFNGKGFNSLAAMIHRFLQRNDVECDRLRQRRASPCRWSGPARLPTRCRGFHPARATGRWRGLEVSAVSLPPAARLVAKVSLMICAILLNASSWSSGIKAARVGRKVQDEISVAADGRVIDVHQLRQRCGDVSCAPKTTGRWREW